MRALPMAQALAARGHDVTMLLPPWQTPEDGGQVWVEGGVTVENIPLPPPLPGVFHVGTALRLARRAMACSPDVVHLFKPKAYSGLTHNLLASLPGAHRPRLVVDSDDWEGPGGWNAIGGYSPLQRRFFAWQERWGLTHADAVTVASRTLESLTWALGVPPARVFYVPNGVRDVSRSRAGVRAGRASDQVSDRPCVLLYTRFFEFSIERLVGVLQRVWEACPRMRLLVVGKGLFGGEEETLIRMASAAGWGEAIEVAGWVEPERLANVFAQADVAIYPFDDTLVNRAKCAVKLLDLLAAGIPVVAEAVGQNREMIRHGETGWLVPPGDEVAFADGVLRLLGERPLRERLGPAASQDVRRRFAWQHLVTTVERAYEGE